jgi:hypothetical protein
MLMVVVGETTTGVNAKRIATQGTLSAVRLVPIDPLPQQGELNHRRTTMGLDQYAFQILDETDEDGRNIRREVAYWRKHPNLQGWMEALWRSKGMAEPVISGEDSTANNTEYDGLDATGTFATPTLDFNCEEVELTLEDIANLRVAILSQELPQTEGFFFGRESDNHYKEHDLQFCDNAETILKDGGKLVYWSWW